MRGASGFATDFSHVTSRAYRAQANQQAQLPEGDLSRAKPKSERARGPRRTDGPSVPKTSIPLTVSRPELLSGGTDRDFRRLVHNMFAFMARHESVRDGHARHIGLAGVEYTILISIGHLGLEGDVN